MSDFNLQAKGLFGRYCRIEMFRYGVPNEFYIHKIVSQNRTNTYCDVPLRWDSKPEKHEDKVGVPFPDCLEEVIWVVQCGIDETKVFPVALKDVELLGEDFNEGCEFQKVGSDGYPFCASATEIMRLRDDLQRANAENAKLRELVRLMVRRHTPISPCKNIPCGECPVKDECDQEDALMRELGVEVDE